MSATNPTIARRLPPGKPPMGHGRRPATLRGRLLLVSIATVIVLALGLSALLRAIVTSNLLSLEQHSVSEDVARARNALEADLAQLDQLAADYAGRPSTAGVARGAGHLPINGLFSDAVLRSNRLGLVLIFDTNGRLVAGRQHDSAGHDMPLASEALALGQTLPARSNGAEGISGLLVLDGHALLVAAHPIRPDGAAATPKSMLLLGRALDQAELQRLGEQTRLTLELEHADEVVIPEEQRAALAGGAPSVIEQIDQYTVEGYAPLADLYSVQRLLLCVVEPRTLMAEGRRSLAAFSLALIAAGLIVAAVVAALIERLLLARLLRMSRILTSMASQRPSGARLPLEGLDELDRVSGAINHMLETLDQTEREQRLRREQSDQARQQLLQLTIHDLKTPISATIGFLNLLRRSGLTPAQQELLEQASLSGQSLLGMVQTLLDTAQMEEGRLRLQRRACDIATLLRGCAGELGAWASEVQKPITLDLPAELPPLQIDPELIRRVLHNLLSNALRHTPRGTLIRLGARISGGSLWLWVWDNGPGIPPEQQRHLFERFTGSGHKEGSGLGLYFCKLAVELHGGRINAQSAGGDGTYMVIRLPLGQTQPAG
ncbi:MAG: hypothetical protein OHK0022_60760 [Roseiflexaceae bacterium]